MVYLNYPTKLLFNVHLKYIQGDQSMFQDLQGVPKKTPDSISRLISLIWKQLLRKVWSVLNSQCSQLSLSPINSRFDQGISEKILKNIFCDTLYTVWLVLSRGCALCNIILSLTEYPGSLLALFTFSKGPQCSNTAEEAIVTERNK